MSPVWLDPYSLLDGSTTADSRLLDSGVSLIRQDTPQLTLEDYRRWQYSPVPSASLQLEHRRIRRKPSIQNLTGSSAHSAFVRTPSSIPPPPINDFGAHGSLLQHPQQPSTPRPRAYTVSPSLSSTITTLQSTPTHTPILRGGSAEEQTGQHDRCELIGTKRKYSSVKRARRFPREEADRQGSRESGIFKVYAAVFDLSGEEKGLSKEATLPAATISKDRALHPTVLDIRHNQDVSRTPGSGESLHRRDQTVTSSLSLSKFEFPAPPNKDNWAGASDYLPKSPSATVLYRGASFDLINPHASLLLGEHNIETPAAEIDCLLDDYFDDHDNIFAMTSIPDSGETSQQSLRTANDSKPAHILYDDADTARRNILRIPTPVITEGKAVAKEPPTDMELGFTPLKRSNTNPFRNKMATIGRSLGIASGTENRDLAEEGRASDHANAYGFSKSKGNFSTQRQGSAMNLNRFVGDDGERYSGLSNPFDLSVSEIGNNAERMNIDGVMKRGRPDMVESASDSTGQRTALTVENGSNTHAMSDTGGDYELSFINRYDYTRDPYIHGGSDPSRSVASIELGRGDNNIPEEESVGWMTPVSPGAQFRSSFLGLRTVEDPSEMVPRPLASRRNGYVPHRNMPSIHRQMRLSDMSDIPTSEQTYGETNQLLQITPNTNPNVAIGRHNQVTRTQPDDLLRSMALSRLRHAHDNMDDYPYFDFNGDRDGRSHSPDRVRTGSVVALTASITHINRWSTPSQRHAPSLCGEGDWDTVVDDDAEQVSQMQRSESPGFTEDEDLDENGDRYSHSPASVIRQALPTNDLKHLALDSFPNLNNPSSEVSPQRERSDGNTRVGMEQSSSSMPLPRIYLPKGEPHHDVPKPRRGIDFSSRPTGDVKRALTIMKRKATVDKLGAGRFMSPGSHSAREYSDMKEMERIRVYDKNAMDEAIARFEFDRFCNSPPPAQTSSMPAKLQKQRNTLKRQNYHPSNSFQKIAALGRQDVDHGSFSSQRGLLSPSTPDTNLEFSASSGTFVTVRSKKHLTAEAFHRSRQWDPRNASPTNTALGRLRSPPSTGHVVNGHSKLRSVCTRSVQQDAPAIDGQIELREFRLKTRSGRKGFSNEELLRREVKWNDHPIENSPHQNKARLLPHRTYQEQTNISDKYQSLSIILPFCALAYGLGWFDWIITRKTQGRITSMGSKQKRRALIVFFPLQLLAYLIVGIVIGIVVYVRYFNENKKHT
ncbi:uncharacterized protein RCC_12213 [Ramularia collo-cygni]|uniref:Uncharacterized protein n=1 Tax=Ramularia collo-cygni TaxID=112498 RepID=A0A2D3UM72_9PEZI|nr:uncharacterized protein RCC_12213 [Ramularia collo-cygni]CZT16162.1 uncharacterized protein RCC_12213 [Ramularia collo-cygni]